MAILKPLILTLAFSLPGALASCGQAQPNKPATNMDSQHPQPIQIDTEKTTIIPFGPTMRYPFDATYKSAVLNQSDMHTIENLLRTAVADYNKSLQVGREYRKINMTKYTYRQQLIAVINANGEKEVWVNCFCDTWGSDKWKREVLVVSDGGSCYFNLKINLVSKKVYDLRVNGEA